MPRTRNPRQPSKDDMRRALRQKRLETETANLTIRKSSRKRLNFLRDNFFRCDDQSMAIDLACLRLTGSLEPWKDGQ